jgi:hypothetical protein
VSKKHPTKEATLPSAKKTLDKKTFIAGKEFFLMSVRQTQKYLVKALIFGGVCFTMIDMHDRLGVRRGLGRSSVVRD